MHVELIVTTAITGVVGWLVKAVLDQLRAYTAEGRDWRKRMEDKVDSINDATQANMRTQLVHLYEKYVTRGWLTPEERANWYDMHDKYSALNANGLINSYHKKLANLPDKEI